VNSAMRRTALLCSYVCCQLFVATQPGEWAKYLKAELDVYTKITKDANIKPE